MQSQSDLDLSSARFKSMEKELLAKEAEVEAALSSTNKRRQGARKTGILKNASTGDEELDDGIVREFVEEEILSDIISEESTANTSAMMGEEEQQTPAERYRALRPTLESLGITKSLYNTPATTSSTAPAEPEVDDTILTSDIDDEEIDSYLLNPDEVKMKEELWSAHYEEFMVALEEKRRLKEEERQREEQEGGTKKKRQVTRKKKQTQPGEVAATASEAIEKIVQEKKLSNKINYEVLKSLAVVDEDPKEPQEDTPGPGPASGQPTQSASRVETPSMAGGSRFKPYPVKRPPPTETPEPASRRFRIGVRPSFSSAAAQQRKVETEEARQRQATTTVDIE